VQRVLYRPLKEKPGIEAEDSAFIRAALDDEIARVESRFGVELRTRWSWQAA
jgi:hypothetical protein